MNPGASPYWTQELPVLEAPDGAEAAADSGGNNNNNNNTENGMMSAPPPPAAVPNANQQQVQAPIHPGQMRPINAANGYAVSSDFVGNTNNNGTMMASPTMMMMPDAAGHHHYDQHHREAQWPGSHGLAAAVHHMSLTNNHHHHPYPPSSSPHSPPVGTTSSNQQMPHNPYSHQNGIPVGQVVPSPYGGGGGYHPHHDHHNNNHLHHEYSGSYHHEGIGGDGQQYYYYNEEDSSPNSNSRGSRAGGHHRHRHGHGNHMHGQKKQKPSLRNPALRAAYWRLKLSLLATTSGGGASSANNHPRQHPQDRTNNPFAARDMANPTKAEAWLAAIGAAESMAQKKDAKNAKTNNGSSRMSRKKKKKHQHHHRGGAHHDHRGRDQDPRGGRGGSEDTPAGDTGSGSSIDNKLLAAGYLKHLFHQLSDDRACWNGPPRFHPTIPNWDEEGIHQATLIVENMPGNRVGGGEHYYHDDDEEEGEDPYMTPNNNRHRGGRSGGGNGSNRYSVFGDDDEDSSGDEENTYGSHGGQDYDGNVTDDAKSTAHSGGSDTSSTGDLSEEEIVYHGEHAATTNHRSKSKAKAEANFDPTDPAQMATRRIVVRVLAALGDIHGVIGIDHSRAKPVPRWVRGASQYAFAFRSLTIGQELLDGQVARMLQAEEEEDGAVGGDGEGNGPSPPTPRTKDRLDKLKAALTTDSEIIAVSLTSFARNRERYLNAATSRIDFLQGRLLEDKESREQAFQGMERELRQAKEGSERVSKLETPVKKTAPMGKKYTEPKSSGGKAKVPEGVVVEV